MSTSYIFGSGASRCAGYPVTSEVMEVVFREYEAALYSDGNSKSDIDVKLSYLKAVQKEFDVFKAETKSNNIELFIKWISKNGFWPRVFPIAGIIYWYLWDRMKNISTIRFHKLFANRIKLGTQIIDFNYDLVLEQAIEMRTLNYPVKYDYISGNEDKIVIYKPMGSINWVIDQFNLDSLVYNEGNIVFGPQFVLDKISGVWLVPEYCLDIAESTGGTFQFMKWFDAIPLNCNFYNKTIEGCSNVLNTSDKIIVFGYSFPTNKITGSGLEMIPDDLRCEV
jgi:hypothetical protein